MSGDFVGALQPVVDALQSAITITDVVNLFASAVMVALPLILIWYGCKFCYHRFVRAVKGGRG